MGLLNVVNRAVVSVLPYMPDFVLRRAAAPYIAGGTIDDAVDRVEQFANFRIRSTLNLLGEHMESEEKAIAEKKKYMEILMTLADREIDTDVSIKLSQLGLGPNGERYDLCAANAREIITEAAKNRRDIWIDMESSDYTYRTLAFGIELSREYRNVNFVVQSRLKRTLDDVRKLVGLDAKVRVCKGIYVEPDEIAYQSKREVNDSYLRCVEFLASRRVKVAIATHDKRLLEACLGIVKRTGAHFEDRYEIQMLLGVADKWICELAKQGHPANMYVPFGPWEESKAYSLRRMKENPAVAGYVIKNMFVKPERQAT